MNFHFEFPKIEPQRLAVKLTTKGERSVRSGHPWIFSDSIQKINKEGKAGDIAIIFRSSSNKPLGIGLYDPRSPIRIKMIHHDGGAQIDRSFFKQKIDAAYEIRAALRSTSTNSYRLLFGENDGFPGCIADVYDEVLVIKLYNEIWLPYLQDLFELLVERTESNTVVIRLSRSLQKLSNLPFHDGQVIYGSLENEVVPFEEHGVQFSANVIKGHKTGYFLDHRHNRKRVGELSRNKEVLDVFSYAGGFSVHALAGGAKKVTSLDISAQALEVAQANAALNPSKGTHEVVVGDAFDVMKQFIEEGNTYDIVVIDPPSFAKSKKEINGALKKYRQLARLGAQLTRKNGLLVLASCSSRISATDFFQLTQEELKSGPQKFREELKTYHDVDHPITFPEGAYLKCIYYSRIS
ncbi:MAG: methyltransferase domain-containing protein [Flavobacteriaceae bacterium]|nr:methyltransferase domain-containing protein [Flavobacteriaceae bacterium]